MSKLAKPAAATDSTRVTSDVFRVSHHLELSLARSALRLSVTKSED